MASGAAIAGAVGGVAGIIPALVGKGQNERTATDFSKSEAYNPNAGLYGGRPGVDEEMANASRGRQDQAHATAGAATRDAGAMYQQGAQDRANAQGARGMQMDAAGMARARAMGQVPSIAQMQADRQMGQAAAAQTAAAASARGPGALALAQQNAAANTAGAHANISGQAQIAAAQERLAAEQSYAQQSGAIRGGDYQGQGLSFQGAGQQQQFALGQGQLGLGYANNEAGIRQGAANAANQQQATLAASHNAAENANQQTAGANASNKGLIETVGDFISDASAKHYLGMPSSAAGGAAPAMAEASSDVLAEGGGMDVAGSIAKHAAVGTKWADDPTGGMGSGGMTSDMGAKLYSDMGTKMYSDMKAKIPAPSMNAAFAAPSNADRGLVDGEVAEKPMPLWISSMQAAGKSLNEAQFSGGQQNPYSDARAKRPVSDAEAARLRSEGERMMAAMGLGRPRMGDEEAGRLASEGDAMRGQMRAQMDDGPAVGGKKRISDAEAKRLFEAGESMRAQMDAGMKNGPSVGDMAATSFKAKPAAPKAMSDAEMLKWAKGQLADVNAQRQASEETGPAVQRAGEGTPMNGYNTELTAGAEKAYEGWRKRTSPWDTGGDYDLRGAFAQGIDRDGRGHLPDTYKKPNHETFSNESKYAKYEPESAGSWQPNDRYMPKGPPSWLRQYMHAPEGPAAGAQADANRALQGAPYVYKSAFRPPEQRPGEVNVGPTAQVMERSPITATAVRRDPNTGLRSLDRDKMLKVVASGVADLQKQQDETRMMLSRGGRS